MFFYPYRGRGGRYAGRYVYKYSDPIDDRPDSTGGLLMSSSKTYYGSGYKPRLSSGLATPYATVMPPPPPPPPPTELSAPDATVKKKINKKKLRDKIKRSIRGEQEQKVNDMLQKLNANAPLKPELAKPNDGKIKTVNPTKKFNLGQLVYKPLKLVT